jgi:hypothetical protein
MDLYGLYIDLYGFIWIYMDYIWIYMDLYGLYMDLTNEKFGIWSSYRGIGFYRIWKMIYPLKIGILPLKSEAPPMMLVGLEPH